MNWADQAALGFTDIDVIPDLPPTEQGWEPSRTRSRRGGRNDARSWSAWRTPPYDHIVEGEGRRSAIPHISALDGARGLAVAGVLLFHGGHLKGGYLGVDFFFTLSGFLITSLLLAESGRAGSIGLGGFWARRARRLLPALAVLMVGVAIYAATLAKPSELAQIRGDAFATLGYFANWHQVFAHQSYFALFNAPSPLNHTWSLAIEEQFYVIWPLLFVALLTRFKRATPRAVLVTSLLLAAVSSVLMITLYNPSNTNRVYFGTDSRAAAILFGAALAAALTVYGPITKRHTRITLETVGIFAAAVLALAWIRLDGQSSTLYHGGFLLCGLCATAIIAAAVHPQPGVLSRALSFRPLCGLGLISYGVYLYHWPIDVILNPDRAHIRGWPLFLLQTAVTLTVAIASYKLIEQPIRHGALTSTQLRRLTPAVAIVLVVALFATTTGARPRFAVDNRYTKFAIQSAASAARHAPLGARRVMIVGNSVADLLGPSFREIHTTPPIAVFDAGIAACVFPPQVTATLQVHPSDIPVPLIPCHPNWEPETVKLFRPDVVFWIVSDVGEAARYHGGSANPCTEPYSSLYAQGLRSEVARVGALGARVVVTTEAYQRIPGLDLDRSIDCNNQLRRKVATETGAQVVDLFSYICPRGICRVKQNGVTLRPDGIHYDGPGGAIVAKWLIDQVR